MKREIEMTAKIKENQGGLGSLILSEDNVHEGQMRGIDVDALSPQQSVELFAVAKDREIPQ